VVNAISYLVFAVDIGINFNMSFFNSDGEEINDRLSIAKNYLANNFIIDLLSTCPFEYFTKNALLNLFGLLKIIRLSRISQLINKSTLDE
jgi:hypothetical protein